MNNLKKQQSKKNNLILRLGALCDPIKKQIFDSGINVEIPDGEMKKLQKKVDSVCYLYITNVITESEKTRLYKRVMKEIRKEINFYMNRKDTK